MRWPLTRGGGCRRFPESVSSTPTNSGSPDFDLTKLVIDVDGLGITGYQAEDALRNRFGVGPEMSDLVGARLSHYDRRHRSEHPSASSMRSPRSRGSTVAAATDALAIAPPALRLPPAELAISPREAFFSASRAIPLAAGQR